MAKGAGGKSGKVRFDGLDVAAMVSQLQRELLGKRIINIYDGVSDSDAFLLKLDGGRTMLFIESGIRFHTTQHQSSLQQEGMPSPFCSKLRKHLRGLRLERVVQLGTYDRVVNFVFGTGESRHSLILELYARGNLILTKASYEILALLRSHEYEEVSVKVGQVYPVTYATSLGNTSEGLLNKSAEEALAWAISEFEQHEAKQQESGKKKKSASVMPLKAFLLKPTSGVYHFGPSLIEHCIVCAGLDPNTKVGTETIQNALTLDEWTKLIEVLKVEGSERMLSLANNECTGYILYRPKEQKSKDHVGESNSLLLEGLSHTDKVLQEFQPHLLKQHEDHPVVRYPSFAEAVDDFYAHLGAQKQALRAEAAESAAHQKLDKIRKDQENRMETLQQDQERLKEHAQLIELHADAVDKALSVINSALDTGMDWEALEQLVDVEQQNRNPIAMLIKKLELEEDSMILSLPNTFTNEKTANATNSCVEVTVSLQESAYGNARDMFAKYRAFKEKSRKTLEASTKALKAAELNAQRQLAEAQKKSKLTSIIHAARKAHWFEKFHWFITSDNYLVLGGRDAHQNETLVKRYLRQGDAYLHADVHGASSCILRAKRRRMDNGKTEPFPLSDQALREAGNFTICRSSAWTSKMVTSAWWVHPNQVSKTAPTGEYLKVGSFMVRGKKNYLPPSQLEMGLAVLFRLGDDDSVCRHKNDRRDFALLGLNDGQSTADDDKPELQQDLSTTYEAIVSDKFESGEAEEFKRNPDERLAAVVVENCDADEATNEVSSNLNSDRPGRDAESEETASLCANDDQDSVGEARNDDNKKTGTAIARAKQRKGLSVKDRKLIKKYGSLEAAAKAAAEREKVEKESVSNSDKMWKSINDRSEAQVTQAEPKRGKRGKLKKAAQKYADQDDEDRELAILALQGGEKKVKSLKKSPALVSTETQEQAGADTLALLVKDAAEVAKSLPGDVRSVLAECVGVLAGGDVVKIIRWEKFDGDVLEQLRSMNSVSQQLAAAKRLLQLKESTRIDNFSASLAGIIRTINKYGEVKHDADVDAGDRGKRKTKDELQKEKEAWKEALAAEGIVEGDVDEDGVDDTIEISKLTGQPVPEDTLLYAVPVCAPYQTLSKYKYRVKLTPGSMKRGKAVKQCVEMFLKGDGDRSLQSERNRELVKRVADNDWVQVTCSDVKISAPGASKNSKKNAKTKNKNK